MNQKGGVKIFDGLIRQLRFPQIANANEFIVDIKICKNTFLLFSSQLTSILGDFVILNFAQSKLSWKLSLKYLFPTPPIQYAGATLAIRAASIEEKLLHWNFIRSAVAAGMDKFFNGLLKQSNPSI